MGQPFGQAEVLPYRRARRRRGFHGGQLLLDGIQLGLVFVGLGSHVRVLMEELQALLLRGM